MQYNDITHELLGRLARLKIPSDARVLSLYLDLDPSENLALPRGRQAAIRSLIDQARRLAESERGLSHEFWIALRADVERAQELLLRRAVEGDLAEGARALALFAAEPVSLLIALRLPRPVRSRVAVARRALIQPLAEIGPPHRWAVLLADGDDARLLEGEGERLVEVERFKDELRRRAGRGVWAPDRTDAPLPEDELAHVRRTVELLSARARERGYEWIAVGADERIWREIFRRLAADMLDRVIGRFDIDADEASAVEVCARVEPLRQAAEAEARHRALVKLAQQGVCGLDATLDALHQRRVRTLLMHAGLERAGAVCPCCARAARPPGCCPLDGTRMELEAHLIDWAVAKAIDQDAQIVAMQQGLEGCEGVAALLRY